MHMYNKMRRTLKSLKRFEFSADYHQIHVEIRLFSILWEFHHIL